MSDWSLVHLKAALMVHGLVDQWAAKKVESWSVQSKESLLDSLLALLLVSERVLRTGTEWVVEWNRRLVF